MSPEKVTQLDSLEARLRSVEDQQSILQTLYRYSHSINYGLQEQWVNCFTEDAVFGFDQGRSIPNQLIPPEAGTKFRLRGRAQIERWIALEMRARIGKYKMLDMAVGLNPQIKVTGDHATVISYLFRLNEENGIPYVHNFGWYQDKMMRCPDGVWRFQERIIEMHGRAKILPYQVYQELLMEVDAKPQDFFPNSRETKGK